MREREWERDREREREREGGYNDKTERQSSREDGNKKNERNKGEKRKRDPLFSVWWGRRGWHRCADCLINHCASASLLFTSSSPSARIRSLLRSPLILLPLSFSLLSSSLHPLFLFFSLIFLFTFVSPLSSLLYPQVSSSSKKKKKCMYPLVFLSSSSCARAYSTLVTVSVRVWHGRWIGLYLGKQNIDAAKAKALSCLSSLPFSRARTHTDTQTHTHTHTMLAVVGGGWRGSLRNAVCCVPLWSSTGC